MHLSGAAAASAAVAPIAMVTDDRSYIRLKDIGAHASHIPDVITDIISDYPGITGIIFRDPCLNLADQIASNIAPLPEGWRRIYT
jgi:hypothetical protein